MVAVDPATGRQQLACRADVEVALLSELKSEREKVPSSRSAHIPDRDVRGDPRLDEPAQEPAGPIGRVGGEPLRLQTETLRVRSIIVRVAATSS